MATDALGAPNRIPFASPEALNEPEKLLAAYFNSPTVGFCILDSDLRYLCHQQRARRHERLSGARAFGQNRSSDAGRCRESDRARISPRSRNWRARLEFRTRRPPRHALRSRDIGSSTFFQFWIRLGKSDELASSWSRSLRKKNWKNHSSTLMGNSANRWTGCRCCWM